MWLLLLCLPLPFWPVQIDEKKHQEGKSGHTVSVSHNRLTRIYSSSLYFRQSNQNMSQMWEEHSCFTYACMFDIRYLTPLKTLRHTLIYKNIKVNFDCIVEILTIFLFTILSMSLKN